MVVLQKEMFDAMIDQKLATLKTIARDLKEKDESMVDRVETEIFLDEIICKLIMRVNGIDEK